jgi:hypothetical protein
MAVEAVSAAGMPNLSFCRNPGAIRKLPKSMKTSERIHRAADRIQAVLDAHPSADANPQAIAELRSAAAELGARDPFASGKMIELMEKAQVFYGRRSLFRLPGSVQRLRFAMNHDLLDMLRMRARVLEQQGD